MSVEVLPVAGAATPQRALVRFTDDEIMEGAIHSLDLDAPDFELVVDDPVTNNRSALVSFASVKSITLSRRPLDHPVPAAARQKVAVRYRDGEVVRSLIDGSPRRGNHAVLVEVVSPDGEDIETLAIPHQSLKALFYLKSWDSRPAEYRPADGQRVDAPLVDLLGEIGRLADLRDRGRISDVDFQRRRRRILDKI